MNSKVIVLNLKSGQPAFVIFADCDPSDSLLLAENIGLKKSRARSVTALHDLAQESGIDSKHLIVIGEKCMFYKGYRYTTAAKWTHFNRKGFVPYNLLPPHKTRKKCEKAVTDRRTQYCF